MSQFLSPFQFGFSAGTWTPTITSDVIANVRTAAAAANTIFIPLEVQGNSAYREGSMIFSVDIWYTIGTADLTDFATVTLEQVTLPGDAVAVTGANNTGITLDATHNTAALRKAQGQHKMTVTITTPIWVPKTTAYYIQLIISAAASSVLTLYGAQINFVERN